MVVVVTPATAAAIVAMEIVIATAATAAEVGVRIANAHLKCPSLDSILFHASSEHHVVPL